MPSPALMVADRPRLDQRERFERHVREAGHGVAVTGWRPLQGGRSADTLRVSVRRKDGVELDCVVHLQPATGPLSGISQAEAQYAVLRALAPTPVPAPTPRWLCRDSSVLGQPFFVSDFVHGEVPSPWGSEGRSWLAGHPPGGALAQSFLRELVRIHTVAPERLSEIGGDELGAAASYPERERLRWASILRASPVFADDPVLAYADSWLATRRPANPKPALVHGDYRIGNLVVRGSAIVGVLDWELAAVGDPIADLGTICAPPLRTNGLAVGLWEPEEFVQAYERMRDVSVDRSALRYHRVLATFKIASLWVNASRQFTAGESELRALRAGFSALQTRPMLAEALGLPPREPAPPASGPSRAAAVLDRVLRDDVLPAVGQGEPRAQLQTVLSVLRAQACTRAQGDGGLGAAVDKLAAAARPLLGESEDRADSQPAGAKLAHLARTILAHDELAADESAPLHAQLRTAVAIAAASAQGTWL